MVITLIQLIIHMGNQAVTNIDSRLLSMEEDDVAKSSSTNFCTKGFLSIQAATGAASAYLQKCARLLPKFSSPMQKTEWSQVGQKPIQVLSPAFVSNGHVFTSGAVGFNADGSLPDGIKEQTHNAIQNLEKVLKASGSSLDKVMKVLLFISDRADGPIVNEIYHQYFPHAPARSCIMVQFPNANIKVELEAVAEVTDFKSNL